MKNLIDETFDGQSGGEDDPELNWPLVIHPFTLDLRVSLAEVEVEVALGTSLWSLVFLRNVVLRLSVWGNKMDETTMSQLGD